MTEEQIRDGYDRMGSALAGPTDALERVERRVRTRRRRRRLTVAGGTAAVVVAAGTWAAVSLGASEDGQRGVVAVDPPLVELVLTRPDGSTYEFTDLVVTCSPPPALGRDGTPPDTGRIWLYSPMLIDGDVIEQPFVYAEGVVAELAEDSAMTLPLDGEGASDSDPLTLFVADTEGGEDGNELVSGPGSSGTVRVARASCDPTPVLELEVDATLVSEEQDAQGNRKPPVDLTGRVR